MECFKPVHACFGTRGCVRFGVSVGAPGELECCWSVCRVSKPRVPNPITCRLEIGKVVAVFNSTLGLRSARFLAKRGYDTRPGNKSRVAFC